MSSQELNWNTLYSMDHSVTDRLNILKVLRLSELDESVGGGEEVSYRDAPHAHRYACFCSVCVLVVISKR